MSRRRVAGLAILSLIALLTAFVGYKAVKVVPPLLSLYGHVTTLETLASSGQTGDISEDDVRTLARSLRGIHDDLESLYGEFVLVLPAMRSLGWVPVVGGDLAAAPDLLEAGLRLTDAGAIIAEAAEPFAAELIGMRAAGNTEDFMAKALKVLPPMQPALVQAQAEVGAAVAATARIDRAALSPWLAQQVARLDRYLPLLQLGLAVAQAAPDLLGAEGPRTYLIVAQNSDELRATGGYISGVGVLTLDQGRIAELDFYNAYIIDDLRQSYPAPPPALYTTMLAEIWLFRDGNWSPDFPTSARTLMMLYEIGQKRRVDGVIVLDLYAFQMLIGTVAPLQVEGFAKPITDKNAVTLIRQAWEPEPGQDVREWYRHHKDFMGTISQAVLARLLDDPTSLNASYAVTALERALRERHVLIYLSNPQMARFLADHGWDGAMRRTDGDFLAVVDTNVGFNKVNPLIEEHIAYRVQLDDADTPRGEVTITYRSRAVSTETQCLQDSILASTYAEMMNRCYWAYVRLYVPEGSRLTRAIPAPLPTGSLLVRKGGGSPGQDTVQAIPEEVGKAGWGAFFVLPPQANRSQTFAYELPATILRRDGDEVYYDLWVQKQPGTDAWPVTVTVVLPPGARLLVAMPKPMAVQDSVITFEFHLSEDHHVELRYSQ